jgi:hypothetical protein
MYVVGALIHFRVSASIESKDGLESCPLRFAGLVLVDFFTPVGFAPTWLVPEGLPPFDLGIAALILAGSNGRGLFFTTFVTGALASFSPVALSSVDLPLRC